MLMTASAILIELQYLGPLAYYLNFLDFPKVYLEACEQYQKGSYRNRCVLASGEGPLLLSIPLQKGKHQQSPIREVRIDYSLPWQRQHWRTIRTCYGSAPFFPHYEALIRAWYEDRRPTFLWDYCLSLQTDLLGIFRLSPSIFLTETYQTHYPAEGEILDFRQAIHPKKPGAYATRPPLPYPQIFEDRQGFLPDLSILDFLLCQGPNIRGAAGS